MRRLIAEVKERNLKAKLVFIDFEKTLDSCGKMLKMLRACDTSQQIFRAIKLLYKGKKAKVLLLDGET